MPRVDLFTPIHKAIRAYIYDLGLELQTADLAGSSHGDGVLARLDHGLGMLAEHHAHEERFVFPEALSAAPEVVEPLIADHRRIEELLGDTGAAMRYLTSSAAGSRREAGDELNRRFNELVAFYLAHLAREEATLLPVMLARFDDAQLLSMRAAITGSTPPERAAEWLTWMARGLSTPELAAILAGAKASAPPEVLDGMIAVSAAALGTERWEAVRREAGL